MRSIVASLLLIAGGVSAIRTAPSVKSVVSDWLLNIIPDTDENGIRPFIETSDTTITSFLWGFAKLDLEAPLYCFTDGFPAMWD